MKILITGTSRGIGYSTVKRFLYDDRHTVVGLDILESAIDHKDYTHFVCDVSTDTLPDVENVDVLINNAGVQDENLSIPVNLLGVINCTEKYGIQPNIKSIINIASASAHSGSEFPIYTASKGGVLAYTKNTALRVAEFGAVCNSISPGGVTTELNAHIMDNPKLWYEVLNETLLYKWASAEEIAEWIYFLALRNKSMTGQDILIDNGEMATSNFVW